jgi:hypothetical protein
MAEGGGVAKNGFGSTVAALPATDGDSGEWQKAAEEEGADKIH